VRNKVFILILLSATVAHAGATYRETVRTYDVRRGRVITFDYPVAYGLGGYDPNDPNSVFGEGGIPFVDPNGFVTFDIDNFYYTDANDTLVVENIVSTSLTALRLISADSDEKLVSVSDLTAWIAGTANQITSTSDGDGTLTLSTPQDIHTGASPTWVGTTWTGKLDGGSQASPIDVTTTRQYGLEFHYSGNDYSVTGIRSRAQLVTTDTTATALGGLFQAANNDGIDAGVLMGFMAEAVGKSTANASTITTMRGGLIGTEWGALDTVTNLKTLHIRGHSLNAAGAGSFGTGYGLYIENEAVGGNGQAYDAGIYFKGTNLSGGNSAYTYGIDFSGGTYGTAELNLSNNETIDNLTDGYIELSGNLVIPDAGYIGSASDTDAIQIEADGDIVMSQDLAVSGTLGVTGNISSNVTDTQVIYSNATVLAGDATFNFNDTTKILDVDGLTITGTIATGLDMSGGTFTAATQNWPADPVIQIAGTRTIRFDGTNFNVFAGFNAFNEAGDGSYDGDSNIGIGFESGYRNDTSTLGGVNNIYIGYRAGRGWSAGTNKGLRNVAIGTDAMLKSTTAYDNFALGEGSLYNCAGAYRNVGIGYRALYSATFRQNVAIGYQAEYRNGSGQNCVSIGYTAGQGASGQSHSSNTNVGASSGRLVSTGSNKTNVGFSSGYRGTTNDRCINIGSLSGYNQTTLDDRLIIDNQNRGSAAAEITNCFIYGVMDATPGSQTLRFNVGDLIQGNPVHSDADGGGAMVQSFIREDGAGTASTAATITVSHDGAGANDTDGKIVIATNFDGTGLVDALTIDSSQNTKIGDGGTTNYTNIAADGTITLVGTATVWQSQDLNPANITRPQSDYPGETFYQNKAFDAYDDTAEEQLFYIWHLPNNFATGTASVRGHFGGMVANEGGAEYVAMGFEYWHFEDSDTYDISGAADGGGSVNITIVNAEGNYVWHPSATGDIDTTGWTDGITVFRFFRDVDGTYTGEIGEAEDDDYTGDVLIGVYHLEYLANKLGAAT